MTHICVGKLTTIGSDNGLSLRQRQAIFWTNAGVLLIEPLGTKFSENLNRNPYIFTQENASENIAAILSRGDELTKWPPDNILQYIFFNENVCILI